MAETKEKKPSREGYKSEYAEKLVEHMAKGFSFSSFAAEINKPLSTIKRWKENIPKFQKAFEIGRSKAQYHWERIGLLALQGGLRTVKSETIVRSVEKDAGGRDVRDSKGKVVVHEETIEREYERIPLRDSMWIFTMKAQFGWRDDKGNQAWDDDDTHAPVGGTSKAGGVKKFLLAYNLADQPYVIKERDSSTNEAKALESVNQDAERQSSEEIKGMEMSPL